MLTKKQRIVVDSKKRFRVLISGRRFGKTHLAIYEMAKIASQVNKRVWYVCPTYRQAKEIVWRPFVNKLRELRWLVDTNETELRMYLRSGSEIALKGADKQGAFLRGVGLDFLVMDEFADIDPMSWYEVLRPTLADTKGSALFCGTPRGFGNWGYDLFTKYETDNEWESFQFTTLDGGQVEKQEIKQARKDLDDRTFKQEFEATFVTYAGAVFYNFNRKQTVKNFKEKNTSHIHIGMDFNIDPMTACALWTDGKTVHAFDDIVIYGSNTDEMVAEIKKRYANKSITVYPDPASKQRKTSAGGRTDLSILLNAGFNVKVRNKHPEVRDRINSLNAKLKNNKGERTLFVDPVCKNTINSLERLIYKQGTSQIDKEHGYDHMADAISYAVEYMFPIRRQLGKKEYVQRWS